MFSGQLGRKIRVKSMNKEGLEIRGRERKRETRRKKRGREKEERAQENPCLIFTSFSLAPTKTVTVARHTPNCQ